MRKAILALSVLAFVCLAGGVYAAVDNVRVSGDINVFGVNRTHYDFGLAGGAADDLSGVAAITRLKVDASLTENVDATVRLINERMWGSAEENAANSDIDLDLAYVTFKEFLGYPLTLKVGRQEFKLGSGMIIGDPDTNQVDNSGAGLPATLGDLSYRKSFDGVVGVLDFSPYVLTLAYLKINEGTTAGVPTLATKQDDYNAYVANLAYDFGNKTMGELYYVLATRKKMDISNIGVRLVSSPLDALTLTGEIAYQIGKGDGVRSDQHRSDLGFILTATYTFLDIGWVPTIGIDYARFSGKWNPMFEDLNPANIINAIFPNTDCQLIGLTFAAQPREDLSVKLRYANLRLVDKTAAFANNYAVYTVNSNKKGLGNEIDLSLKYDYTEDVQFGLGVDYFNPGSFFASANDEDAFQTLASMKVAF